MTLSRDTIIAAIEAIDARHEAEHRRYATLVRTEAVSDKPKQTAAAIARRRAELARLDHARAELAAALALALAR